MCTYYYAVYSQKQRYILSILKKIMMFNNMCMYIKL